MGALVLLGMILFSFVVSIATVAKWLKENKEVG